MFIKLICLIGLVLSQNTTNVSFSFPKKLHDSISKSLDNPVRKDKQVGVVFDSDQADDLLKVMNEKFSNGAAKPINYNKVVGSTKAEPAAIPVYFTEEEFNSIKNAFAENEVKLDLFLSQKIYYNIGTTFGLASMQRYAPLINDPLKVDCKVKDAYFPGAYLTNEYDKYGHKLWYNPHTKKFYYYPTIRPL